MTEALPDSDVNLTSCNRLRSSCRDDDEADGFFR
jgi:hypothetical protein